MLNLVANVRFSAALQYGGLAGGVTKNVPFVEFEGLIRVTSDNMAGWDIVMRPCFRQLKVNSCALKFLGFWVT